jgi:hypothetical protein
MKNKPPHKPEPPIKKYDSPLLLAAIVSGGIIHDGKQPAKP